MSLQLTTQVLNAMRKRGVFINVVNVVPESAFLTARDRLLLAIGPTTDTTKFFSISTNRIYTLAREITSVRLTEATTDLVSWQAL